MDVAKQVHWLLRLRLTTVIKYAVLIAIVAIVFIPLSVILLSAFKTQPEMVQGTVFAWPKSLYLNNFTDSFKQAKVLLALKDASINYGNERSAKCYNRSNGFLYYCEIRIQSKKTDHGHIFGGDDCPVYYD